MRHGFVERRPEKGTAEAARFNHSNSLGSHSFRPFVKALGNAGKGLLALSLAGAPAAVTGTLSLLTPRTAKAQQSLADMQRLDRESERYRTGTVVNGVCANFSVGIKISGKVVATASRFDNDIRSPNSPCAVTEKGFYFDFTTTAGSFTIDLAPLNARFVKLLISEGHSSQYGSRVTVIVAPVDEPDGQIKPNTRILYVNVYPDIKKVGEERHDLVAMR